jgi:M3 family oligoendopeptidase
MKFSQFEYVRPELESVLKQSKDLLQKIEGAKTYEEARALIKKYNKMRSNIQTNLSVMSVRHTINTNDKFYDGENKYWDEKGPLLEEQTINFYKTIFKSKYLPKLKKDLPPQFFKLAEFGFKSFKPEIIKDLQVENKLATEYGKLIASAQIEFEGKKYTLAQLTPFILSKDRAIREKAYNAKMNFFVAKEKEIDKIYDQLVKVRTKIAKKLGYKNFTELAYIRMARADYKEKDIKVLREQVLDFIVPLASKLYEKQAQRLGLKKLRYFDEKFEFESGNPTPKGDAKWMVKNAQKMYKELSKETGEFFDFMIKNDLMDLEAKPGKRSGGYCTFFSDLKAPFIFSNFNGTSGDVDVLTHEAGHAFQVYRSRDIEVPECHFPTYESAEIHSMSMEFFTWKWMDLFFKKDTEKYHYSHLGSAIKFIPYGTLVDHFQHEVYNKPNMTPAQRKATWRKLEKKYLPHKDYQGMPILEKGAWWFQQSHIFSSPFYYIDYVLAQTMALQFFKKMNKNFKGAWKDYLRLCDQGGKYSFLKLVEIAGLESPFKKGSIEGIIKDVEKVLLKTDDSKF